MAKQSRPYRSSQKTNWKASSRLFLIIGLSLLFWSSVTSWIYRDGFEPDRVRSSGAEAISRFGAKVWPSAVFATASFVASWNLARRGREESALR